MKKLNDLKDERTQLTLRYNNIMSKEEMTDELRSEAQEIGTKIEVLDKDIKLVERADELAKREVTPEVQERTDEEVKPLGQQFQEFLRGAVEGTGPLSFRVEPMLTTSNTDVINKTVANSLDILISPAEAFLRTLGVTFFPGLTGNFVVPSMAQDHATFPGENTDGADASMNVVDLVLAARRVTHAQSITKETLAQTNPAIYNGIVQNLVNGLWNAITYDLFDTIQTDAHGRNVGVTTPGLIFGDLVNMESSIGGLNIGAGAYVTTPAVKGYLKQKIALGTTAGPAIWGTDNTVNGYPAYGVPAANTNKVYFGDFSRTCVGQWGGIEIIVDPYTLAKAGKIALTAVALADTGVTNVLAVNWINDVSAAV